MRYCEKPARVGLFRCELGGVRGFNAGAGAAKTLTVIGAFHSPTILPCGCAGTGNPPGGTADMPPSRGAPSPLPHRKKSLYVNKAAKTTLYSHKGSFFAGRTGAGSGGAGRLRFLCLLLLARLKHRPVRPCREHGCLR